MLRALGRDERLAESSLRFSLGRFTTRGRVDAAVGSVTRAVTRLRRIAGAMDVGIVNYNDLTRRHFETAAHAGIAGGARSAAARRADRRRALGCNSTCASSRSGGAIVRGPRFLAFGCPHVIAVADWLADSVGNRTLRPDAARSPCARCASASRCRSRSWAGC